MAEINTPTRRDTRSIRVAFIAALAIHGNVSQAAKVAGIHRDTHYAWLKQDATYRQQARQARTAYCAALIEQVRRHIRERQPKPEEVLFR